MIIFPYMVNRQSNVPALTQDDFDAVGEFKKRALELDSVKGNNLPFPLSRTSYDENGEVVEFSANTPNANDIVNLAVKFRFFYLKKEPTQFERIVNLLGRQATDDWARNYINRLQELYKRSMRATNTSEGLGHPVKIVKSLISGSIPNSFIQRARSDAP